MARWLTCAALCALLVACGVSVGPFAAGPSVDLSAGVPHEMTPDEVEQVVLDQLALDAAMVQLPEDVPPRVLRITLLAPGQLVALPDGAAMSDHRVSWAVVFEGNALCGTGCAYTFGTFMVNDAERTVTGAGFGGRVPCPRC